VLAFQYLVVYFHRVCPAVVAPELVAAFNISGASLGVLASGYFYSYAIMQIPVGLLSDSWGTRKTVALFSSVAALGSIIFALAPTFTMATLARVLVGLGVSATFVSSLKALAEWFSGREYARISGLLMAMGGLGWLAAATPLAFLTESFGWRSAFILIGGIAVLLAALTWFFVIDRPDEGIEKDAGLERSRPGYASDWKFLSSLADIVRQKYFWTIAVWLFFAQGTLFSFYGLWAGPYLMDTYALSKPAAGNILSMIAIGMVVGGPFLGHLSDRVLESRKRVLVGASAVNVFVWSVMIVFYETFSLPALFGIFFLMGITTSSIVVIVFTTVKELFPLEMAGTAIGTANLFGFFGGIVFQPLIGYILDIAGKIHGIYPSYAYQWTFWVFLGINLISLISILFSKETISTSGDRV